MEAEKNRSVNTHKAWVVSAMMGLGHMRAAYPLRDIANEKIIIDGSETFCLPKEYAVWKRLRQAYYFMSRAERIPLVGKHILNSLSIVQEIPPYYPMRDLSNPTPPVKYLRALITKNGLCSTLMHKVKTDDAPLLNTFYATAIAIDTDPAITKDNYLVICDADFNRVWVAEQPKESRIKYIAPCTQVEKRLLSYGVPPERIFLTGFPLPKENIGSAGKLEVLKADLFNRLLRLDPSHKFFNFHGKLVGYLLGTDVAFEKDTDHFTLTFAVGGAGAQAEMAGKILKSLKNKIMDRKIKIVLSAGIREEVFLTFMEYVQSLKLAGYLNDGVEIVYDEDIYRYFEKFNKALRKTDVLWTKPSELSFYCALGLPILMAPTVGSQEELNMNWLQDIHAGVKPLGPVESTDEWLFDLRESGILAEAAWDGFLKGRKLGTFKIEELIATRKFTAGHTPLER